MIISISIAKKKKKKTNHLKSINIIKISTLNIPGLERCSFNLINGVHKNGHHMASGLIKCFSLKLGKRKGCRNQLKGCRLAHSFLIYVSWTLANFYLCWFECFFDCVLILQLNLYQILVYFLSEKLTVAFGISL